MTFSATVIPRFRQVSCKYALHGALRVFSMAVIQALRQAPGALVRTPVLVVPALVLYIFSVPELVLRPTNPALASVFSMGTTGLLLLVVPFYMGGMVGMADEALDGQSSLRTFLDHGKASFVQVLVGYLLLMVVNVVLFGGLLVVGFAGLFAVVFEGGTLALVGLGLIAAVLVFAYLLITFLFQFYAQAIVLEERTAIDGLRRSYRVVRTNLRSTVGYTAVVFLISLTFGVVFGGLGLLTTPEAATMYGLPVLSTGGLVAAGLVVTFVGSVISTFHLVYAVSFYRLVTR